MYAYAGWNTHANTLGTVLGTGMISDQINSNTICNVQMHVLEDGYYQAKVRMDITRNALPALDLNYFDLKDKQEHVISAELDLLEEPLKELKLLEGLSRANIVLSHPWNRMFEVDLYIK